MHFIWYLILWPLKKLNGARGAPKISLDEKYLTTANPYEPIYNTPESNPDLILLTSPTDDFFFAQPVTVHFPDITYQQGLSNPQIVSWIVNAL